MNRQKPSCGLASQTDVLAGSVTLRRTEAKQGDRNQEHIETDHLLPNLKRHTTVGGAIMISAQAAKFVLSLGSTVILARLLTPGDFGLVAMVTAVTGFVVMLVTTWSMHTMVDHTHVLAQLVICASVGMFAGVIFICMFQKQRTVATDILDSVRELTKKV